MEIQRTLFCLPPLQGSARPFAPLFSRIKMYSEADVITKDDVLLFEGGTDIDSRLYRSAPSVYNDQPDYLRDAFEEKAFRNAARAGAALLGICRGSQFLTAMAGGALFQHVSGHSGSHNIKTWDGKTIQVTSTHHQMMNPFVLPTAEFRILGWALPRLSKHYFGPHSTELQEPVREPEIVFYPKIRALAIQGHPEYSHATQEYQDYCVGLVTKFLFS